MPRSHSNLHHSIERTQIDRSTLWKNDDLSPIRGDMTSWSSRLPCMEFTEFFYIGDEVTEKVPTSQADFFGDLLLHQTPIIPVE